MISDREVIMELKSIYPDEIMDISPFPMPYPLNLQPDEVKAIYLGCDPTNTHGYEFNHVFALGDTPPKFKGFVTRHTNQLKAIGLEWKDVFVQNLCRNYFNYETSKNLKTWKKLAKEYWIEKLRAELEELKIPESVPVLLTSKYLFDVLVHDKGWLSHDAPEIYEQEMIPIPGNTNLLNRPLIPIYRGFSPRLKLNYHLLNNKKWDSYRKHVIEILN